MSITVAVRDETSSGTTTNELTLDFLTERTTVRELIRSRVYQEVSEYNARTPGHFRGLIQPTEAERVLNGYQLRPGRRIDWEAQYARALEAFARNRYLLLVDGQQRDDLDDEVELHSDSQVCFLRLMPLMGG
jgi:hypothetical protein